MAHNGIHAGGRPRLPVVVDQDAAPQQLFYTVPEVCAMTGLHKQTVQARLRDGTLKGKKLGREWRIYPESLFTQK